MGQTEIRLVLSDALLSGDGWMTVKKIREALPTGADLSRKNTERYVRNMLAYGMLDFRFRDAKTREVRLKASYIPKKFVSCLSRENAKTYYTTNAYAKREKFSPGGGKRG